MAVTKRLYAVVLASCWGTLLSMGPAASQASRPATALVEQVRIESEPGVVLAGELNVPGPTGTRHPAVLLLGGGGASPHGIYPLLEARLHARGIATLSFDKRGIGRSTGVFVDAMEPAQRDARAALAYLRSRRDVIDGSRIAVLGLSQGGVIGPALAVNDPPIAAVVMLAAPAGERGIMFLDAMRVKLTASGMVGKAAERIVAATRRYLDALTGAASPEPTAARRAALVQAFVAAGWQQGQAEGAVQTIGDPATSSLYTVAASAILSRVKAPVLAIYAGDDTVVSTPLSMPEARRALANNRDAMVVEIPNVEHGFKSLVATASGKKVYEGWPISDPATLDVIDRWLSPRLMGPAKNR